MLGNYLGDGGLGGWVQGLSRGTPKDSGECTPQGEGREADRWKPGAVGKRKKGQERRRKRKNAADKYSGGSSVTVSHTHTHSLTRSVTEHFPKQLMS